MRKRLHKALKSGKITSEVLATKGTVAILRGIENGGISVMDTHTAMFNDQ